MKRLLDYLIFLSGLVGVWRGLIEVYFYDEAMKEIVKPNKRIEP
jgi:hypothetical protein